MEQNDNNETLENKRKRLIFRSWHRGTREMDLLMGTFAAAHVPGFETQELALYDEILHHSDPDLYNWISGREEVPAGHMNAVMTKLLAHDFAA